MEFAKKILFPVDLSEVSPKIAVYVNEVASKFGAEVHVVFVARVLEHFTSIYVPHPSVRNFEAEIVKGAERRLDEFVGEHFRGVSPKVQVVLGDAAEEILNYIRSQSIDLVIMGTHGRKGLERIVFGSVAERVVQKCQVPVLTINPYGKAA